jgi:hypothetical protein
MSETFRVIDDDPLLGKYIRHYTTNRMRLLVQAGVIYAIAVVVIQVVTASLENNVASIVVPILYTLVGLPLGWYLVHLWNREVILYERGFTYRQGSTIVLFLYLQIVSLRVKAERVVLFGIIPREVYECQLLSDQDDKMTLNNLYGNIGDLLQRIERAITQARRPVVQAQLERGERVPFGAGLWLTSDHLEDETTGEILAWTAYRGYRVEKGTLVITAQHGDWRTFILSQLENATLLVSVLKDRAKA